MITREFYGLDEVNNLLDIPREDLYYLAYKGDIKLGAIFEERSKAFTFKCKVYIKCEHGFKEWLMSANANVNNDRHVSGGSYIEVISDTVYSDDSGEYIFTYLKGYWHFDDKHIFNIYDADGDEEEWPSYFSPDVAVNEDCEFIKAIPIYEDEVDYFLNGIAYLSGRDFEKLKARLYKNKSNNTNKSIAQKERHAKPRAEILMAVISIMRSDAAFLNCTATKLTDVLFERAHNFWPDEKEPPLEYETIKKLISDSFKFGV